ncbi:fimbrillin family protein [uncultured Bacteroides sp.]|uniref:fimbrillin family protein n=1 Tax=uncultured Bacteroides sp. TaxID=162156 RepID=UPI002636E389|nr:fimbrillin family protein [uncultured Bacteroides sp.]
MKKKIFCSGAFAALLGLASCQQNESDVLNSEARLGMNASVSNVNPARTSVSGVTTSFVVGDKVGFFMPESETPVEWSYSGTSWSPTQELFWPDQTNSYSFCAFYPYVESATRTSVPVPDLSTQTGVLEDIADYDFLVASTSCSYKSSNNGSVEFTGASAFKHQLSLIKINLKNASDGEITLKKIKLEGKDLMSTYTYNMTSGMMEKKVDGSVVESWEKTLDGGAVIQTDGYPVAVLCNPSEAERGLTLSLEYERDGYSYTASTTSIKSLFESGKLYQYTIMIEREGLVISGNEIIDWNTGETLEDIIVKDESATV